MSEEILWSKYTTVLQLYTDYEKVCKIIAYDMQYEEKS